MKKTNIFKLMKSTSLLACGVVSALGISSLGAIGNEAHAQLAPIIDGKISYVNSNYHQHGPQSQVVTNHVVVANAGTYSNTTVNTTTTLQTQQPQYAQEDYVVSNNGKVVKTTNSLCVRTGSYNAATANHPDCDMRELPVVQASTVVLPPQAPTYVAENALIYFNFDSEFLPYQARKALDTFVENAPKGALLRVEAAADFLGTQEYNQLLSERRARAIANYLLQKDGVRVGAVIGLGEREAKLQKVCKQRNKGELIDCIAEDRFGLVSIQSLDK